MAERPLSYLCEGCRTGLQPCVVPTTTCKDMVDAWGEGFAAGRREGWKQADRARSLQLPEAIAATSGDSNQGEK